MSGRRFNRRKFIQQGVAAVAAPTGLLAGVQETCPLGHQQTPFIFGNMMVAIKLADGQPHDYGDEITSSRVRQCAVCNVLYMGI